MGVSYRIEKDLQLLVVTGSGAVSDVDVESYLRALVDDPDLGFVQRELADFREAKFSVSPSAIARIAEVVCHELTELPRVRRAAVVSNDLQYGLARMYGQYVSPAGHEVVPFRDMTEAREWLGISGGGEDT